MNILVLNCGSSSVKYKLIDTADKHVLAEGGVEKIGLPDSFLKFKLSDGSKKVIEELKEILSKYEQLDALVEKTYSRNKYCILEILLLLKERTE